MLITAPDKAPVLSRNEHGLCEVRQLTLKWDPRPSFRVSLQHAVANLFLAFEVDGILFGKDS